MIICSKFFSSYSMKYFSSLTSTLLSRAQKGERMIKVDVAPGSALKGADVPVSGDHAWEGAGRGLERAGTPAVRTVTQLCYY
jgi:hypothetical protein